MISRFINALHVSKEFLKKQPLLCALLINVVAFFISISIFDVKYETVDDYMTDAVLSGAFGNGYDPNLLWGNPILGYALVILYKIIPNISFYFVLLEVMGFASLTSVIFILLRKKNSFITHIFSFIFLLFYADDLYILIQFTKTSVAAGIAGGLLVLYGMWEDDFRSLKILISGIVLAIIASMIRFDSVYIFLLFLMTGFIRYSVVKYAETGFIKILIKRFTICVLLVFSIIVLSIIGNQLSNMDEDHRLFNEFHEIRYPITDVYPPNYDSVRDSYNELGLDYLDWKMINRWSFVDRDVYSDDVLREIALINKADSVVYTHSFAWIISVLKYRGVFGYWSSIGVCLIALLAMLLNKNNRAYSFIIISVSVSLLMIFAFRGRVVYRIEWGVLYSAAACLVSTLDVDYNEKSSINRGTITRSLLVVVLVFLIFIRILTFMPVPNYINMTDDEYRENYESIVIMHDNDYYPDKQLIPNNSRKPYRTIVSLLEDDDEHFYYVDFYSGLLRFYHAYDPWIRPEYGLLTEYSYFGSVTMHHPGERYALLINEADPDSPYRSLTNDNIYLIDSEEFALVKLDYVRRYYCPNAEIELVAEVDGLYIWNIYVPALVDE